VTQATALCGRIAAGCRGMVLVQRGPRAVLAGWAGWRRGGAGGRVPGGMVAADRPSGGWAGAVSCRGERAPGWCGGAKEGLLKRSSHRRAATQLAYDPAVAGRGVAELGSWV